jgi:hypothetical protein
MASMNMGVLPTIKCSNCGCNVEIMSMGDHTCIQNDFGRSFSSIYVYIIPMYADADPVSRRTYSITASFGRLRISRPTHNRNGVKDSPGRTSVAD